MHPREDCLTIATNYVTKDRNSSYGEPEDTFRAIAEFWSVYKGMTFTAADVAIMMDLMKTARLKANPTHLDSWVDKAGYAACGYEIAFNQTNEAE